MKRTPLRCLRIDDNVVTSCRSGEPHILKRVVRIVGKVERSFASRCSPYRAVAFLEQNVIPRCGDGNKPVINTVGIRRMEGNSGFSQVLGLVVRQENDARIHIHLIKENKARLEVLEAKNKTQEEKKAKREALKKEKIEKKLDLKKANLEKEREREEFLDSIKQSRSLQKGEKE